jgi:hypothetical protein
MGGNAIGAAGMCVRCAGSTGEEGQGGVPSSGMPTGMSENEASARRTLMLRIGRKLRHLLGRLPLGDDLSRIRHTPLE